MTKKPFWRYLFKIETSCSIQFCEFHSFRALCQNQFYLKREGLKMDSLVVTTQIGKSSRLPLVTRVSEHLLTTAMRNAAGENQVFSLLVFPEILFCCI